MTSARLVVGGLVAALLLSMATPPVTAAAGFASEILTPGPERYAVRTGPSGEVTVSARAPLVGLPLDWNRREILVRPGDPPSRDQTVCATWTERSSHLDQEGLAVRVRAGPGDRMRAVTLTRNTYANYGWVFNLLTWDTDRSGDPWRPVAQFDMSAVVSSDLKLVPLPWRVCLRAHGSRVDFKVWLPGREPEPLWTDLVHARSTTLRHRFERPGVPGWYVGHLEPGDRVTYADLTDSAVGG